MKSSRNLLLALLFVTLLLVLTGQLVHAQSTGTIQGAVLDAQQAAVAGAKVTVKNLATGLERSMDTDSSGSFSFAALPAGNYKVEIRKDGFQTLVVDSFTLDVATTAAKNYTLQVGQVAETMEVTTEAPVVEAGTMTVGQTIDQKTVQEIPLNGRHFVELASLVPGTVVPPVQNAFLTAPLRGQGPFAVVTAGNREDTVNFMINGINLNDMANGQITFQPSINTVQEFKIDNSTYSAQYGRNSGAIVNIATRSGTNAFHGEAFEFLRNEWLDARNFFNKATGANGAPLPINPFKRNQFGGAVGGPIIKNKTFFFASYEGLRQRQAIALSTNVLTEAQRAAAQASPNPTIPKLLPLIPSANDSTGTKFIGSAVAPVNIEQGTMDISHNIGSDDRLHGYYVMQHDLRKEPTLQGGNVPAAGDTRESRRQIFTFAESHVFNPNMVNEARLGFNRIRITFLADNNLVPADLGFNDGVTTGIGIPQVSITSTGLRFGGIRNFPQGRGDYTAVLADTLSWQKGRHALKFGGEFRRFNGNFFTSDAGNLGFATVTDFINGNANAFAITLGNRASRQYLYGMNLFAQDNFKLRPYLTLELGLRWEWNMTPTEAQNRHVAFIPATDSLVRLGTNGLNEIYEQNDHNFEPRIGFSWDMFHDGRTILRGGYGFLVDQPLPIVFSGNPPFATPLSFTATSAKPFTSPGTLVTDAQGSGITVAAVDPQFRNPYVQSWNLNVQREIMPTMGLMIGYFGSKGTHLNTQLNINQLVPTATAGVMARPFPVLSASSPILPGTALGNITDTLSIGNSSYNALWLTVNKRISHRLQFNGTYTWSKSIDWNSRNFEGVVVQDSTNPRGDRGLSDFDARHHFHISTLYDLPFKGNRIVEGWRLSTIVTLQSGNPLTIFAGDPAAGPAGSGIPAGAGISSFTGLANTRPDLVGTPPSVSAQLITSGSNAGNIQWFPSNVVCDPRLGACPAGSIFALPVAFVGGRNVYHFGTLGRNALLVGPDFKNVDFSISKTTKITERLSHEFRAEFFDLFNHPNFSNPGTIAQVGSSRFGVINSTRAPTGDAGSSRQIQFAMKLTF